MAEVKSRFRIRNGEIEIEYEGSPKDVNERYRNVLDWVISRKKKPLTEAEKEEAEKKSKRGGVRKAIYPKEIQALIEKDFFKPKKSLDDVIKKFESMGVPARGKKVAIRNALIRETRKKDSKLKATKEDDTWVFWVD
jgi:hypothetical protein